MTDELIGNEDIINKNILTFEEMQQCKNYNQLAEAFGFKFHLDVKTIKMIMYQIKAWEKFCK